MKRDLAAVIRKTSDFLIGRQYTESQISTLVDHLSFDKMKNNPYVNYEEAKALVQIFNKNADKNEHFMRSGTVGSYKKEISPELEKLFDKWIEEHLKETDLTLY